MGRGTLDGVRGFWGGAGGTLTADGKWPVQGPGVVVNTFNPCGREGEAGELPHT